MCTSMNDIVDMESVEEMLRFLEAGFESEKETESVESEVACRPIVFVGQVNEKNEEGFMRVNVSVGAMDEDVLVRYLEPVGVAQIPREDLKENKETELMYQRMKKEFDALVTRVDARKAELVKLFEEKDYPVFLGVLS